MKILLIDNYDSFTYNLYHYISNFNKNVEVVRNDKIDGKTILKKKYNKIVISPGPGNPNQAGNCLKIVKEVHKKIPILGVCLGHQIIGQVFGGKIIRAMEIIDELEKNKRKLYAGGIGYFTPNGEFDTCIALRTALIKNNKFYVQAGACVVADSKPDKEYIETINKAKALMRAVD